MIPIPVTKIAQITGGVLSAATDASVTSVVRDNREVTGGSLFAALKGERVDGHDFIASAFDSGAVCALAGRVPEGETRPVIVVPEVEKALRDLAAYYRGTLKIPVIGVTGSVGKTTTKEMISSVLSSRLRVHKTPGNYNNELGVPLTLFGIEDYHEAAVVELGISHFGEMRVLAGVARPDIAVFTAIGHAHLETLLDREGVLRAKTEMLECMTPDAVVILNGDDDLLASIECSQRRVLYGTGKGCAVRGENIVYRSEGGISCDVVRGARRLRADIPGFGGHLVSAALAAACVGFELGLSDGEIISGLKAFETVGSRARLIETKTLTVFDDCYNSNPTSAASALRSLCAIKGRRVAILGDMLELGADSERYHFELGALAAQLGVELVLCCGDKAMSIADGAGGAALRFKDKKELISALPGLLIPGDAVLVKASRGMRFEEIVNALT